MCDYAAFRTKARTMFPSLVVSVMMFDKGSGKDSSVTMYRLKVAGMAIGADITSQSDSAETVLAEVLRRVIAARKAKKDADTARALARRAAAAQPVKTPVAVPVMVAQAGENQPQQQPARPVLARAA